MGEDLHAEKLAWFKRNENPEAVLLVAEDSELLKVAVAWTSLDVLPVAKPTSPPDDSDQAVWDWLRANVDYSIDDLDERSGLTAPLVERKLRPLTGNRVLYPDGTVNSFVQRYLRERVLKLFDTKSRRSSKTP